VGETNQYFDLATFECHNVSNAFSLEMGQWTDDCAMGLCVWGKSLIYIQCSEIFTLRNENLHT
jgi:hypothetical protein